MTPAAFGAMMAADTTRWAKITGLSGVKPELEVVGRHRKR